jgi:hypothetical protein
MQRSDKDKSRSDEGETRCRELKDAPTAPSQLAHVLGGCS